MNLDTLFGQILPGLAVFVFFAGIFYLSKSKGTGKELVKNFVIKRDSMFELGLAFFAFVEAMVAASVGAETEGIPYFVRFGMHFGISFFSAVAGFSIFPQAIEAGNAMKNAAEKPALVILEWLDVIGCVALMMIPGLINLYYIAVTTNTMAQLYAIKSMEFTTVKSGTIWMSVGVLAIHILGAIVLGLRTATETYRTQLEIATVQTVEVETEEAGK